MIVMRIPISNPAHLDKNNAFEAVGNRAPRAGNKTLSCCSHLDNSTTATTTATVSASTHATHNANLKTAERSYASALTRVVPSRQPPRRCVVPPLISKSTYMFNGCLVNPSSGSALLPPVSLISRAAVESPSLVHGSSPRRMSEIADRCTKSPRILCRSTQRWIYPAEPRSPSRRRLDHRNDQSQLTCDS